MISLFDALHRGGRGFERVREERGWGWWRAPWKRCLPASACPPCRPLWIWCPRNSSSLKVCCSTNQIYAYVFFLCVWLCLPCSWLTNCMLCPLWSAVPQTPLCHALSSSSPSATETRPLCSADVFMLTPLCLLTGALMLTGKLTRHHLKLRNVHLSALLTGVAWGR